MSDRWKNISGSQNNMTTVNRINAEKVPQFPLHKPKTFYRTRKEDEYSIELPVLEDKSKSKIYVVDPCIDLDTDLQKDLKRKKITLCQTIDGLNFLMVVRAAKDGESLDQWSETAHAALEYAKEKWIRLQPDTVNGLYTIYRASEIDKEPVWPEQNFSEILDIAFKEQIISTLDHPFLKKLRGEV